MATVDLGPVNGSITLTLDIGAPFGDAVPGSTSVLDANTGKIKVGSRVNLKNASVPQDFSYRILVVNMAGETIVELENAVAGEIHLTVAEVDTFDFTISSMDAKALYCQSMKNEVQVYRGKQLLFWGPIVRVRDDGKTVQAQCQQVSAYFQKRVFGPVPKPNMIANDGFDGWKGTHLPRSSPTAPPAYGWVPTPDYNGRGSIAVSSSVGRTTVTEDNDDIYLGTDLTSTGKAHIDTILADTIGASPQITVHVYDDNVLTPHSANLAQADARAQSVADYILSKMPLATVKLNAEGYQNPLESNRTSGGRDANRRTTFTYRDDDGKKGAKQVIYQRFTVRNPSSNQKARLYTLSCYGYLMNQAGFAANFAGVELVRSDALKAHPDRKWRKRGYKKPIQTAMAPIGPGTPLRAWVRYEVSVTCPNDGGVSIIEPRLYAPNGDIYWTEIWLTSDDSLWFKDREQADIISAVVAHAQDESMGKSDLNIDLNCPDTGITRSREYVFSERGVIADALEEFPTLANGVEWDVVVTPTTRTFTTFYPRMGKDSNVVLSNGGNVVDYSVDSDGTQISTSIVIQNDGEGSDREERTVQDASLMDGLVLERAYSATPNSPASSWRKQAERGLARYRRPVIIPTVTISPEYTTELLREVGKGDRVLVNINDEFIQTAQMYRVNEININPSGDSLSFSLYPEDIGVKPISGWEATGWRYFHQAQSPIVGTSGHVPVQSNPEYAAPAFDDSGWSVGQGGIGWVKDATGSIVRAPRRVPKTTITTAHELWMRKTVKVTGDMYLNVFASDWFYVYVNGHLLRGTYGIGENRGGSGWYNVVVPKAWLDPSGVQVIALHTQYMPSRYTSDLMDSVYGDMYVLGTYDERLIL